MSYAIATYAEGDRTLPFIVPRQLGAQVLGVKHCGDLFCPQMRRALWQVFAPKTAKWCVTAIEVGI